MMRQLPIYAGGEKCLAFLRISYLVWWCHQIYAFETVLPFDDEIN